MHRTRVLLSRTGFQHIVLVLVTVMGLAALFMLPYLSVRKKTIEAFNQEQMTLANQAIRGIQSFFTTYDRALRYLATQDSIVDLDDSGRLLLQNFHTIHSSDIAEILWIDAQGQVTYKVPQIAGSGHGPRHPLPAAAMVHLKGGKPVITDIIAGQRPLSIAFAYPLFSGTAFHGCIAFRIPFSRLARNYLDTIALGRDSFILLVSKNGTSLYSPRYAGRKIGNCFSDAPDLLALGKKMMAHERGSYTFSVTQSGEDGSPVKVTKYAVFAPIDLPGENYWSIAVATLENEVLSTMERFRDQWLLVTSVALFTVVLLSFSLTRTLARHAEIRKQRAVEEQIVKLLEFIPLGIIVSNAEMIVTYANRAVLDLIEKGSPEAIIGRRPMDFIHPEYRPYIKNRLQNLLDGSSNDISIIKVVTASGREREVEMNSTPLMFNGQISLISILRDVTEQRRAEETQRRLVTAIEQAKESIVITNDQEIIEYVNPAFTEVTGFSQEEAIGKTPALLRSGEHEAQFYEEIRKTISRGEVWQGRIINRRKNGQLFTESATISPVRNATGKITHFVAVKRDITHEVELESQLRQAQKMEAIGTLAGGIAHDFNNILGSMLGFTDIALMDLRSEGREDTMLYDNLVQIRKGGKRAADLVQQILTFSRQSNAQKMPVTVAPLIKENLKLLRASLPATISIRQRLQAADAQVLADPVQIQQIVMNLCTNAFHAMREHGGELVVGLRLLPRDQASESLVRRMSACLELTVRDTGVGMEPAELERIFDPFYTTKSPGEGTGMGLSVVHGILSDLGGEIQVESTPGQGTTFTVLLPSAGSRQGSEPHSAEPDQAVKGKEHIVVVDDEEGIRAAYKNGLERLGFRVTTYGDPMELLDLVEQRQHDIDLVLTDQTMPGMTGLELTRELLVIDPDLPIILCTGYSDKLNTEVALKVGARKLLSKPVGIAQLAEAIRWVLDHRELTATL